MRKQIAFVTALMALTLGVGILAGARQSTDSHGVDVALEEARQHATTDGDDVPALREKPQVTLHYPATDPAEAHPILRWSRVDGAVMYDVQILKKEEEKGDDGRSVRLTSLSWMTRRLIRRDWNWICPIPSWDRSFTGASAALI